MQSKQGSVNNQVLIIGGGLAGCEAAWQVARQGVPVVLFEQKPHKRSPAHHSDLLAELVCSNSLRADDLSNAAGLLKQELRLLGSLIMQCADDTRVPAGGALAVDRDGFAKAVTDKISSHPLIELVHEEILEIPEDTVVIVATGPLTDGKLADNLQTLLGSQYLYFYDAAAPIISFDSVDQSKIFRAARYNKGGADYVNCPMTKEQYEEFYEALVSAETVEIKGFEDNVFEGCMPIEVMARRGQQTLLFGPLKPVGLTAPDGSAPHAVVQLRQDNAVGSLYNMVGFQTHLKFNEQQRVFRKIPGLEKAEFMRYGVMHRNTYINSPELLDESYSLRQTPDVFFAGQITGVEGYIESVASGLTAGLNAAARVHGKSNVFFGADTAIGALAHYVSNSRASDFQPMNINFGIINPLSARIRNKKEKNEAISQRALSEIRAWSKRLKIC